MPTLLPPVLFAHRGARAHAPENTLQAFRLAVEMGATGLESDVWITSDGVAVLDHDGFADPVDEVPIASVRRDELPDHIPSLDDLYRECGTDLELSLDLKDPLAIDEVLASARRFGATDRLWLCFHRWRELAEWRDRAAGVRLVDSTYVGYMSGGPEQRAGRLAAAGVDAVNLHHSEWRADLVELFGSHGLASLAWDAQDSTVIEAMCSLGVQGIFSDHVDRLVAVAGARRER